MSPLVGEPPGPVTTRLVSLGPITLPTLKGDVSEMLGDQLETIGGGVAPGERRPRTLPLTIPVRGDYLNTDRRDAGLRLRRQVRALIENSAARLQGLYLNWSVDVEQNGWLLIGGAELKPGQGGITFADFELELSDCYRVANMRTHRPARRIVRIDRRLATTPRDILGTLYSTDFASVAPYAQFILGAGITDAVSGATRAPVAIGATVTREGALIWAGTAQLDGDVIDFEQAAGDMHTAIVRIYDTHGSTVESDWGPVYGPDQPLYGVPVLDNAVCRVVANIAVGQFDVQSWTGSAWQTDATLSQPGGATGFRLRVVEWTTERAVICMTSTLSAGVRGQLYLTLQRGWSGPRAELYATNSAGNATANLDVYARSTGDGTYQRSSGAAGALVGGVSIGTFAGLEPWVALLGPGTDRGVALAVLQSAVNLRALSVGREGLRFESPTSYVSVTIGLGDRATAATDAAQLGAANLTDARTVPEIVAR